MNRAATKRGEPPLGIREGKSMEKESPEVTSTIDCQLQNEIHTSQGRRKESLPELSTLPRVPRFLEWLLIWANCYEYGLEMVAFVCRILVLRKARKVQFPFRQLLVDLGPLTALNGQGHLETCISTRARTSYIQKFASKYAWTTPIDRLLTLEGWDAGAQWVLDNLHTGCSSDLKSKDFPCAK
jgi:hypothetical protein